MSNISLSNLSKTAPVAKAAPHKQGVLGWIGDILSRPLNAVLNPINQAGEDAKAIANGQHLSPLKVLGDMATAPARAFFGTNPDDHPSTSNVIENWTDAYGKENNPNYVDTPNNVNPVLKGVAGFAGDVLLDPLTYLGGGVVKGAELGEKGVSAGAHFLSSINHAVNPIQVTKDVIDAGRGVASGAKALKQAVDARRLVQNSQAVADAERVVADAAKPSAISADTAASAQAARDAVDKAEVSGVPRAAATAVQAAPTPKLSEIVKSPWSQDFLATSRNEIKAATTSPKGAALSDLLKGFKTQDALDSVRAAKTAQVQRIPMTQSDWHDALFDHVNDLPKSQEPKVTVRTLDGKSQQLPLSHVMEQADNASLPPRQQIAYKTAMNRVYKQYTSGFMSAAQQGRAVDPLGKALGTVVDPATLAKTPATALEAFHQQRIHNEETMRSVLGDQLFNNLAKGTDPAKFDQKLSKLTGVLDGSVDVHHLRSLGGSGNAPIRQMLGQLGIDHRDIPTGVMRVAQPHRNPVPLNRSITDEDVADAVRSGAIPPEMAADPDLAKLIARAKRSFDKTFVHEYTEPLNEFKQTTDKGVLKLGEMWAEGDARRIGEFNTGSQATSWFDTLNPAIGLAKQHNLGGAARANFMRQSVLPVLRLVENKRDALGIQHTIGIGADRIPLSMSQILDTLEQHSRAIVGDAVWNGGTSVPPTALLDAVQAALKGAIDLPIRDNPGSLMHVEGDDAIRQALSQNFTRYTEDGRSQGFDNALAGLDRDGNKLGVRKGLSFVKSPEQRVNELADLIKQAAPDLQRVAADNAAASLQRTKEEIHDLSGEEILDLAARAEGGSLGAYIQSLADITPRLKTASKDIGATTPGFNGALGVTEAAVDDGVAKEAASIAKRVKASKATTAASFAKDYRAFGQSAQELFEEQHRQMLLEQPFVSGGAMHDFGQEIQQSLNNGIAAKLGATFNRSMGNKDYHELLRESESVWHTAGAWFARQLNAINRQASDTQDAGRLNDAFRAIQTGVRTSPDERTQSFIDAIEPLVEQVYGSADMSVPGALNSAIFRNAIDIEHINQSLKKFGIQQQFSLADLSPRDGESLMDSVMNSWRTWPVEDPLQFLMRSYAAFNKATTEQTLVNEFLLKAKQLGALTTVPTQDYERVIDYGGKSALAKYMPTDIYVHRDALRQLHVIDQLQRASIDHNTPFWKWVDNNYVPLLDAWKFGMTLPNPTHHIRNLVGDSVLQYVGLGGEGYAASHVKTMRVMKLRTAYDGWDWNAALQGRHATDNIGTPIQDTRFGSLTADELYSAAEERGNLPTFQQTEMQEQGLEGKGVLTSIWDKARNSSAYGKLGSVSEGRDHYVRLAHFIQFVDQNKNSRKYRNITQLLDAAGDSTRKWHPDGSDLTKNEHAFKLVVPFYSWTRKAIPLVFESMIAHPNRVTFFNKASYNLGVATGVNPDSLSDPFPDDQLFPSYLTDQAFGPQIKFDGKYYGISPGIATWDTLDSTIAGNPVQNVLGNTFPLLRAPIELVTKKNLATGGDITDTSDYLDSNIPVLSQIARLTGYSPTGSAVSLAQGTGFDKTKANRTGNTNPASVLNWLTGIGIEPMSNPNQISYAEIEQRNAAKTSPTGSKDAF